MVPSDPHPIGAQMPPAPLSMQLAPQRQPAIPVQGCPKLQPPEELPLPPPLDEPLPLLPLPLPLDPPEELPPEHTHELHVQLDVQVSVPLQVPVLQDIVVPGLQTPPPAQLPHWPDELHVSIPVPQSPQLIVLPTAHCPVQLPPTHVWLVVAHMVVDH
jgi:hypothetical protein